MMREPLTREELNEELCNYCGLEDNCRGARCYGGEPVFCVDSGECEFAYERYLEEFDSILRLHRFKEYR